MPGITHAPQQLEALRLRARRLSAAAVAGLTLSILAIAAVANLRPATTDVRATQAFERIDVPAETQQMLKGLLTDIERSGSSSARQTAMRIAADLKGWPSICLLTCPALLVVLLGLAGRHVHRDYFHLFALAMAAGATVYVAAPSDDINDLLEAGLIGRSNQALVLSHVDGQVPSWQLDYLSAQLDLRYSQQANTNAAAEQARRVARLVDAISSIASPAVSPQVMYALERDALGAPASSPAQNHARRLAQMERVRAIAALARLPLIALFFFASFACLLLCVAMAERVERLDRLLGSTFASGVRRRS